MKYSTLPRRCARPLGIGPLEGVVRELRKMQEDVVMIVGHEPQLSWLGEVLCSGDDPIGMIQLKKAGCIAVETPINEREASAAGKLLWIATPAMLRAGR